MKNKNKIVELKKAGVKLPRRVVKRTITKEILPWLGREEIIIVTGARQTGKSVLLFQLIYDYLLPKTSNIFYFNLDVPHHRNFINNQDNLINLVNKSTKRIYVFIDEVQRLTEPGLFLKGIYDLHLPIKIIASGSSALEIKSKVHETLTGRKIVFHLFPFNLEELSCALFPQQNFTEIIQNQHDFKKVFEHHLIYGGYPAVALVKNKSFKLQLLKEIFQSYIEKDIKSFLKVENENAFRNLIRILSSQIGNLLNKDELSNSLGIHKNTLDNYLFYLEQTFIVNFVRPFYKNPRKELLKNPKIYFNDLGFRNFAIDAFENFEFRPDKGGIFENFSYLSLKNKIEPSAVHFWRTKAGAEVDFTVLKGLKVVPFEIKATNLKEPKISKSLRSFIQTYQPQTAYCINLFLNSIRKINNTLVRFLRPSDLLKLSI